MALIYIVEDDNNIQEIESYALKGSGYNVQAFCSGEEFYEAVKVAVPDLVLLDIMLPGDDGLTILKKLRTTAETANLPVIMVTAKTSEIDAVKALDQGADDYINKPFGVMELMSRVRAVMRRTHPIVEESVLRCGSVVMDVERRACAVDDQPVELTFKEFELLKLFLQNTGIVLTRDVIMDSVWESDYVGETRTVDMHIKTLRKKLGDAGSMIVTVRNVGYKME